MRSLRLSAVTAINYISENSENMSGNLISKATSLHFRPVDAGEKLLVLTGLAAASLPTEDISEKVTLFGLFDGSKKLLASGGLELFGEVGLLRSVAVDASMRGRGYGQRITREVENCAKERGVKGLYLLTTTAKAFFVTLGYQEADRQTAPGPIMTTSEFSQLCPSSATFMHKSLA